jgi:hypothetical protein
MTEPQRPSYEETNVQFIITQQAHIYYSYYLCWVGRQQCEVEGDGPGSS